MPTRFTLSARRGLCARPRQRGVVMIITLITLALLMLAAAAMMRSVDTSSVLAGNLAFRRDLSNQAERGIVTARALLVSGIATETTDLVNNHYSAVKLANNGNGVPSVLASDTAFSGAGMSDTAAINGVTVRYVIDRQCAAGTTTFDTRTCEILEDSADSNGTNWLRRPGGEGRVIYRISVRVTGPRNAQAYYQATFVY